MRNALITGLLAATLAGCTQPPPPQPVSPRVYALQEENTQLADRADMFRRRAELLEAQVDALRVENNSYQSQIQQLRNRPVPAGPARMPVDTVYMLPPISASEDVVVHQGLLPPEMILNIRSQNTVYLLPTIGIVCERPPESRRCMRLEDVLGLVRGGGNNQ